MSDSAYLKCSCQQCGTHLEFPATGIGEVVDCPHCGAKTALVSEATEEPTSNRRKKFHIALGLVVFVIMLAAAGGVLHRSKMRTPIRAAVTNLVTQPERSPQTPAQPAQADIETNQFQIGAITLDEPAGSGITYAVGTLKNNSERQRFGVKITLDVMDAEGHKVGSTSDYLAVLEPFKDWRFRALVTEPGVSRVKLAGIGEQK